LKNFKETPNSELKQLSPRLYPLLRRIDRSHLEMRSHITMRMLRLVERSKLMMRRLSQRKTTKKIRVA